MIITLWDFAKQFWADEHDVRVDNMLRIVNCLQWDWFFTYSIPSIRGDYVIRVAYADDDISNRQKMTVNEMAKIMISIRLPLPAVAA